MWLFENFSKEIDSTAAKHLNWTEGKSYIKKLGGGGGQYVKYKGKDSLPKGVLDILESYLSADIAVYRKMANFNRERAELQKLCKVQ